MEALAVNRNIAPGSVFRPDLMQSFIEYVDVKEATLKGYMTRLRAFAAWLSTEGVEQPTRADIKAYKAYLEAQEYSAGTRAQYLQAVKVFFKWTASEGLYPNVADNVKTAKVRADNTKKEALTEEDVRAIVSTIERDTEAGKRDYALMLLCVTCGLRLIEVHRANVSDIETIRGQKVIYIQGKGRDEKDACKKVCPELAEALEDYLNSRKPGLKPLFTGTGRRANGQRLEVPSLSRIVKTRFKAAGYDSSKLTAHSLRHTSATVLFKSGADLYTVQQHQRHSDPKTTEIYIHAIDRERDQSEQIIYNRIFKDGAETAEQEAARLFSSLGEEQKEAALEYLRNLAK